MTSENVLICVNYGLNGARLIERSLRLAEQMGSDATILVFGALPETDFCHEKTVGISRFRSLADRYEAEIIFEKSHAYEVTKVIAKTAKSVGATEVIIGEFVESLWSRLIGGSTIDSLLKEVPSAHLRVVPRAFAHEHEEWNYERGIDACLCQREDGLYELSFIQKEEAAYDGVFFKHVHTDFNNGRFTFNRENSLYEVQVHKGTVYSLEVLEEDA